MLSYYVIISNNVVCFTAYKIPQINYRQFIILSIYVLSIILSFVLLQRSIITCFVFKYCKSASSSISNMFVQMIIYMQSNNFRWHHQKESYSSYYHLTPDKNGIIEHFLGLKRSQNGVQEASAPVNLTCPF